MEQRLYIVTRADLPSGLKVAQACHAALVASYKGQEQPFVIVLETSNEKSLYKLAVQVADAKACPHLWSEPDMNDELTAISFYGTEETKRFTKGLSLVG